MTRSSISRLIVIASMLMTLPLLARQASQPAKPADPWKARLEALRPDSPGAYLDLGEEIADAAASAEQKQLARQLFSLAAALDPKHLGRSACLALADLEDNATLKRRLLALASLLDPTGASSLTTAGTPGTPGTPGAGRTVEYTSAAGLAVSEAIGRYRHGQGTQALAALKRTGAMELLEAHAAALPGGLNRFLEDCKQMRGARPSLSSDDVIRLLRLEELLLSGADRTWASELNVHGKGEPLLEVDPDHLEETLGVDARRPIYRNGRWVEK